MNTKIINTIIARISKFTLKIALNFRRSIFHKNKIKIKHLHGADKSLRPSGANITNFST